MKKFKCICEATAFFLMNVFTFSSQVSHILTTVPEVEGEAEVTTLESEQTTPRRKKLSHFQAMALMGKLFHGVKRSIKQQPSI